MPTADELLNQAWQVHLAGQPIQAEQMYRQVLASFPGSAAAWTYLGMALHDQMRFEEAVAVFQQSLALDPNLAQTYQNMGKSLGRLRRFDEAIVCFDRAILLLPTYLNAYKNKARAEYWKGDIQAALQSHLQTLALAPSDVETRMNIGMIYLRLGDTARGWPEYQWRWNTKDGALPQLPQPLWDGSSLNGKSILLTPEQGLGDSIQFVRYAAFLKERFDCRVVFRCPRALVNLLSTCPGIDQLVTVDMPPVATDYFAPLLHIPAVFGHAPTDFPCQVPYITASEHSVQQWRERLANYPVKKIGIAWRGSPLAPADAMRSIPLGQFAPVARVPDVQLFSLQKGPGSEELAAHAQSMNIVDLGSKLDENTGAFVETAAVLRNLDLLIACDTAIIHVAGALGVPVWVAVGNVPDWRWMIDREDVPAYPSMRLFRQPTFGDWPHVFNRIAAAMR